MLQSVHFSNQTFPIRHNVVEVGRIAAMCTEVSADGIHVFLEFNTDQSLVSFLYEKWLDANEQLICAAARNAPGVADAMIGIGSPPRCVSSYVATESLMNKLDCGCMAHAKRHGQLEASISLRAFRADTNGEMVNAHGAFTVEKASEILNVHEILQVRDEMMAKSEKARCPVERRGRVTPSQAVQKWAGVCNEQVPSSEEKICSGLHGNMQRQAEMTCPDTLYDNISVTMTTNAIQASTRSISRQSMF